MAGFGCTYSFLRMPRLSNYSPLGSVYNWATDDYTIHSITVNARCPRKALGTRSLVRCLPNCISPILWLPFPAARPVSVYSSVTPVRSLTPCLPKPPACMSTTPEYSYALTATGADTSVHSRACVPDRRRRCRLLINSAQVALPSLPSSSAYLSLRS